ncbi:MAG: sigma-70 family RNA polymerase sigma factor, partial [Planctomycetota bacterium]
MSHQVAQQLETHGKALRALARDLVGDHVADDLVQETALQALESPPSRPGSLGGWFTTVLRRLASKHRRSERRRTRRERESARPESVPSEAETTAARETLTRLTSAVLSLPQPYQATVLRRYLQDQPPRIIATSTGQSVATVKSQLRRGLQMLRVRLEADGGVDWRSGIVLAFALGVAGRDSVAAAGVAWTAKTKAVAIGGAAAIALGIAVVPQLRDPRAEPEANVVVAFSDQIAREPMEIVEKGSLPHRVAAPAPANVPSCEVRVVDHASGLPVAGARVLVVPHELDMSRAPAELVELAQSDRDAFLHRVSPFLETDENGMVRVATHVEEPTGVVASKGSAWGEGFARGTQSFLEVRLRPDRTLRVRVVDASGRAAPLLPVELRTRRGGDTIHMSIGTTDSDGLVTLSHVQTRSSDEPIEHCVVARFTGGESDPVGFDPTDPPREVIVALPATGTVRVRLIDAGGRALDAQHFADPTVSLKVRDALTSPEPTPGVSTLHAEIARLGSGGEAVFTHVSLGKYLEARGSRFLRSPLAAGPTSEHPNHVLELREPNDLVILTGRLVNETGEPERDFDFALPSSAGRPISPGRGRTDADGRFRLALARTVAGPELELSLRALQPGIATTPGCQFTVRPASTGTNELGDLVVSPLPLLVRGRVFVTGKATVRMHVERRVGETWEQVFGIEPAWTPDREFVLHGSFSEPTPLRLCISAQGLPPTAPVEFEAGTSGLEIVLQRGGSATATMLLDAGLSLEGTMARMHRIEGSASAFPGVPATLEAESNGRLRARWRGLPAGHYRLQVAGADESDVVHVVEDLVIGEGECTDARLLDIDLRGRVRGIDVRVLDADGVEIHDRDACVIVRGGDERWRAWSLVDGSVRIPCGRPVDLLVLARSHRASFVDGVESARTVQ